MANTHTEMELKFAADKVQVPNFLSEMMGSKPTSYESIAHDDDYYRRRDGLVLRHRLVGKAGELTYKRRRSSDDLTDRLEINLKFGPNMDIGDVQGFLLHTGHERWFTIRKPWAHIFKFQKPDYRVEVALYSAALLAGGQCHHERRFLEVEVVGPTMPIEARYDVLNDWSVWLHECFGRIGQPLNESLFEIFSKQVPEPTNYVI